MRAEKSKSDSRCDSRVVADLFCDESGFTTLGAALAILLSCSLLFFGLWTSRSLSRAAGVQAVLRRRRAGGGRFLCTRRGKRSI